MGAHYHQARIQSGCNGGSAPRGAVYGPPMGRGAVYGPSHIGVPLQPHCIAVRLESSVLSGTQGRYLCIGITGARLETFFDFLEIRDSAGSGTVPVRL